MVIAVNREGAVDPGPAELDEILAIGLAAARWSWRSPFRRRYVRLPARAVRIKLQIWHSVLDEYGRWGYTPRQARQMRKALIPVLASYEEHLTHLLQHLQYDR